MFAGFWKKRQSYAAGIFLCAAVLLFLPAGRSGVDTDSEALKEIRKVIEERYVETVSGEALSKNVIPDLLAGLDPFCEYLSSRQYEMIQVRLSGNYSGIGTRVELAEGLPVIREIKEGSPAEIAGLKVGDKILTLDGVPVEGKPLEDVIALLRGETGSHLHLQIQRDSAEKEFDVEVVREAVELNSISSFKLFDQSVSSFEIASSATSPRNDVSSRTKQNSDVSLRAERGNPGSNDMGASPRQFLKYEDKMGYIKIDSWQDHTAKQFNEAFLKLKSQGMRALVIDLRNNEGGSTEAAIELADRWLSADKIIVSIEKRNGAWRYRSLNPEADSEIPLAVLVNSRTASASEIFAAALQENHRALLIGENTYGKGSVQEMIRLSDGSVLRLTTARYLTPYGSRIDGKGIFPDVVINEAKQGEEDAILDTALEVLSAAGMPAGEAGTH